MTGIVRSHDTKFFALGYRSDGRHIASVTYIGDGGSGVSVDVNQEYRIIVSWYIARFIPRFVVTLQF